KTPDGRVIDGQIEVQDEATLSAKLKAQKMTLVSATRQGGLAAIFKTGPRVKTDQITIFCRQFSTMIGAGLPVLQALNILCEQAEDKVFKEVLAKIRDDIGGGANLSDAMSKYPSVFDTLFCNMIRAGELSGALDQILDRLSTYLEKAEALKSKIKGAMTYPVTIMIIAAIIVIILMVKVVPTFKTVFESFGGQLPTPTRILLGISEFEQKWALVQVGSIAAFVFIVQILKRTERGGMIIDELILKMPVFGILVKKQTVARFSRTLGTLLKSGVQILDALDTVARSSGNKVIEKALLETRSAVREGQSLTEPLKATKLFPPMVVQMVSVGEETGKLDDMLLRMSDFYDTEVDTAVDSIMSMIEPMIMAVLGVVIGGIVVAMFVPMFSMGSMVS
ncbi:MAG TPA: type II secretion system F family protein, partial [Candidatus Goldiibacteriota bacterium]|nr:type II secretion system F family protein [Candidatus Goldiibacteriota bacterium]